MIRKNKQVAIVIVLFFLPVMLVFANIEKLSFQQALELAMQNNHSIEAVKWQRKGAEQQLWSARGDYLPQLILQTGYSRYENDTFITSINKPGVFPPMDNEIYSTSIKLQVPLFDGFRTSAKTAMASSVVREVQVREEEQKANIMLNVAELYLQAMEIEDASLFLAERLSELERKHYELKLLYEEGRVSSADIAAIESVLDLLKVDREDIYNKKVIINSRLSQITGIKVVPLTTGIDENWLEKSSELINQDKTTAENSYLVQKAKLQLKFAEQQHSYSKRSFFPELSGFGLYNLRAGSDYEHTGEWVLGVNLSLPLFMGGKRIATAKSNRALKLSAEHKLSASLLQEESELQLAINELETIKKQLAYINNATAKKLISVSAQQDLQSEGRISLSELLTQENELLQMMLRANSLSYKEAAALLSYHYLSGNLSLDTIQKMMKE